MKNFRSAWTAPRSCRRLLVCLGIALPLGLLGACNLSSGTGSSQEGTAGDFNDKPDGDGSYFLDPHEGGRASRLHIAELTWGRLVDVYDVTSSGTPSAQPVLRDFIVREDVQSDGADYLVELDPVTQQTRLVILRTKDAPDTGAGTFEDLLRAACSNLPVIDPKHDDGSSVGPFSFATRNGVLVARFDDLLEDGVQARDDLQETVRVVSGYPPTLPFTARIIFDPNFGGVADGRFHSTRVLIDTTITTVEMADMGVPLPGNPVGLPASAVGMDEPNVTLRLPSRIDIGSGQFTALTNLRGSFLGTSGNGPVDFDSPTVDVVRAMRAGNETDLYRGFLRDEEEPSILGTWPLVIDAAHDEPTGVEGIDFIVDLRFPSPCQAAPRPGDVLQTGTYFVTVTAPAGEPDVATGIVRDVRVRALGAAPLPGTNALLGAGQYHRPYDPALPVEPACWVRFIPPPTVFPAGGVAPDATVGVRFSEPMNPATVRPFDSFMMIRGDADQEPTAVDTIVGRLSASAELTEYSFVPALPLDHQVGQEEVHHLEVVAGAAGVTDLAGNPLALPFPAIEFTLDPQQPSGATGGIVLRFSEVDEFDSGDIFPGTKPEVRGQFTYDLDRGVIQPRPVVRQGWPADDSNPIPNMMFSLPLGFATPLVPLGSKLQTLWRYADLGWDVRDELLYNLDVEALNWKPFGGQVVSDYFEQFEIKLAHGFKLPDEAVDANGNLFYPNSGLLDAPSFFADNVLHDPESPQTTVHSRGLGYRVDPNDVFLASSGTLMLPFPLNRGGVPGGNFTWRDTAVLAEGGPDGGGLPLSVEIALGLYPGMMPGDIAGPGEVPSFGLPLLMEFSCFPSNNGIGLNGFHLAVAALGQVQPSFRVHSTGGVNTRGNTVLVQPDLELVPSGGYDPNSNPPGASTRSADPTLYFGQLDTVTRISRVHTIWFPTGSADPNYVTTIIEPAPNDMPPGTDILIEYRGAAGFSGTNDDEVDAGRLDAYGDVMTGSVTFWNGDGAWTDDLDDLDGAAFVQVRLTFVNNTTTGRTVELSSLALAFEK